jgi:hypothetical protein
MDMMSAAESKALVLTAFDTLFNKRDYAIICGRTRINAGTNNF